jgi:DNA invertase Pin-like site-specific DNA recombinase
LGPDEVKAIYFDPRSQRQLANEYGISPATVQKIKAGKVWAHTTGHVQPGEDKPKPDQRKKLTDNQVMAIREDTRSARKIAADYGVSHVTVYRIKSFRERQNAQYWSE